MKVLQIMFLRILAYFVPFAINFLTGGFFFITSYRFAQADCPALIVGGAVTAWGIAYCLITMFVGRITRPGNALHLILAGGLMLTLTSVGFIVFFNNLYSQFLFLLMSGCGAALFCTPFQLLAKNIESASPRKTSGAVSAASFYTFTWSVGFASGPLAFARLAPRTGFYVTLALALAVTLSVICIALILRKKVPAATAAAIENDSSPAKQPEFSEQMFNKLAILGWIGGSVCTLAVCQIRSMWSKLGGELEFSRDHIAYVLALVSYVQALTGLSLCKSKCWMWKKLPLALISVCGVIAMALFAFAEKLPLFYLAAVFYGIYCGCTYFMLVHNSLFHPRRSNFFVAGNEVVVGITSMLAPLAGGLLADSFKFTGAAFIFAGILIAAMVIVQYFMLKDGVSKSSGKTV